MEQHVQNMDDILYKAARVNGADIPLEINFHSRTLGDHNNALHVAAQYGNLGFITEAHVQLERLNGEYYLHLCHRNSKGETPLHVAAQFGHLQIVQLLMPMHSYEAQDVGHRKDCSIERDNKGDTPAHKALIHGHDDIAVVLLGEDPRLSVTMLGLVNNEGGSLTYLAAENQCYTFINTIFGGNRRVSISGNKGQTFFHSARRLPKGSMCNLIHKIGIAPLKKQDDLGKTVLHYAVEEKIYYVMEDLLKADNSLACLSDNARLTPLHKAFEIGLFKAVKSILKMSPQSAEVCGEHGKTPLHYAKMDASFLEECRWKIDKDILKLLINGVNEDGNTALHVALINSEPDAAYELLQFSGCNLKLRNKDGCTPWDLCKSNENIPQTSRLFQHLRTGQEAVEEDNDINYEAAQVNGAPITFPINFRIRTSGYDNNALHVAARYGNLQFIREAGCHLRNLNEEYYVHLCYQNSKGETPLHVAAQFGHLQVVEELMSMHSHGEEGVDVNRKKDCWKETDNNGDTPAHKALIHGHGDVAVTLLVKVSRLVAYRDMRDLIRKIGKALLKKQDNLGKTVLHYAVEEKRYGMVKGLLEAESSLACVRDDAGLTPLHKAFEMGSFKSVKLILKMSPRSIEVCGEHGKTPLHYAKMDASFLQNIWMNIDSGILKLLINGVDEDGNTAFHVAIINTELDVMCELVRFHGCNFQLRNKDGYTPWHLCKLNDNISQRLLYKNGKAKRSQFIWRMVLWPQVGWTKMGEEELGKWLDKIGVAAALLLSINFSTSFSVPGGYSTTGHPNLQNHYLFSMFRVSNIAAVTTNMMILVVCTFGFRQRGLNGCIPPCASD